MELIQLVPAYQDYVWGGSRIPHYFQRNLPAGRYAESWEVSDRIEGMSLIGNGPKKGMTLKSFLNEKKFPLLVKIIDAKEHLSVQIHPNEEVALMFGGEPKNEMWLALEKSSVYAGLKEGVTKEDFLEALKDDSVVRLLRKFLLEKGEAIFIPAGLVHAICGDSLLLEVQQNSNTTYRLYDWGRKGRELHLEKGLSCMLMDYRPAVIPNSVETIVSNRFFNVKRCRINDSIKIDGNQILFCISGIAKAGIETIQMGQTWMIQSPILIQGNTEFITIQ